MERPSPATRELVSIVLELTGRSGGYVRCERAWRSRIEELRLDRLRLLLEFFVGGGLFSMLEFEGISAGVGRAEEPVREEVVAG